MMRHLPNALTASRLVMGILLVLDSWDGAASGAFVWIFFIGALTDGIDGYAARRLHAASEQGARFDAFADAFFYLAAMAAACFAYPGIVRRFAAPLVALLSLQAVSWIFSLVRFRRLTSYHTVLAKTWGVFLFVSLAVLFAFQEDVLLGPMFVIACASIVEDIAITALLREGRSGIPHVAAAIALRRR